MNALDSVPPWTRSGCDEHLAVVLRRGEQVERILHAVKIDVPCDQRRDIDLALSERTKRIGEFGALVCHRETYVELLGEGPIRGDRVASDARTNDDESRPTGCRP